MSFFKAESWNFVFHSTGSVFATLSVFRPGAAVSKDDELCCREKGGSSAQRREGVPSQDGGSQPAGQRPSSGDCIVMWSRDGGEQHSRWQSVLVLRVHLSDLLLHNNIWSSSFPCQQYSASLNRRQQTPPAWLKNKFVCAQMIQILAPRLTLESLQDWIGNSDHLYLDLKLCCQCSCRIVETRLCLTFMTSINTACPKTHKCKP